MAWHGITDGKDRVDVGADGSLPVSVQDYTGEIIDLYLHQKIADITLAANTAVDDTSITLEPGHGVVAGNTLCFKEDHRFTQVKVLSVNVNTVVIDTPLDSAYTVATDLCSSEHDLSTTIASLASPQIYNVQPPGDTKWDITRILIHIEDSTVMDTSTFGGLTRLTNGIVIRVVDGYSKNILNIKSNGEMSERAYDVKYETPAGAGPVGVYEVSCRRSFNGPDKNGAVIRLDGATQDQFQIIVQDDVTGLDHFHIIVQGHVVTD